MRASASSRSTRAIFGRRCTRMRSPVRTSAIVRSPKSRCLSGPGSRARIQCASPANGSRPRARCGRCPHEATGTRIRTTERTLRLHAGRNGARRPRCGASPCHDSYGTRHAAFSDLPTVLSTGDLLVANESATLAASLHAHGPSGTYTLDLSTRYADGLWLAEPRWDPAHPGPMPIETGEEARGGDATRRYVAPYPGIPRRWVITADPPLEPTPHRAGVPTDCRYARKV